MPTSWKFLVYCSARVKYGRPVFNEPDVCDGRVKFVQPKKYILRRRKGLTAVYY